MERIKSGKYDVIILNYANCDMVGHTGVFEAAVKAVGEALGDTGRILVRESGTEPLVRVMVEAPEHETCEKYVQQVVDVIKAKGYAI